MTEQELLNLIALVVPIISTLLAAKFGAETQTVKGKVSKIKEAVIEIDKALEDEKVTDAEFRKIFYKLTAIVRP